MVSPDDEATLREAVREASRRAFSDVRGQHPGERFYYFALVTTADGLRPGPCACSVEGLARVCATQVSGQTDPAELRWSEADSPYNLVGDEHFREVETLFLANGDHRSWASTDFEAEVAKRFRAMEDALRDLDAEGFFGKGQERAAVVINVVAPGDEDEERLLRRAETLNPEASLVQLRVDLGAG